MSNLYLCHLTAQLFDAVEREISPLKSLPLVRLSNDRHYVPCAVSEHLGTKLEDYCATLPVPVIILRQPERGGLIRARLKGEIQATDS